MKFVNQEERLEPAKDPEIIKNKIKDIRLGTPRAQISQRKGNIVTYRFSMDVLTSNK